MYSGYAPIEKQGWSATQIVSGVAVLAAAAGVLGLLSTSAAPTSLYAPALTATKPVVAGMTAPVNVAGARFPRHGAQTVAQATGILLIYLFVLCLLAPRCVLPPAFVQRCSVAHFSAFLLHVRAAKVRDRPAHCHLRCPSTAGLSFSRFCSSFWFSPPFCVPSAAESLMAPIFSTFVECCSGLPGGPHCRRCRVLRFLLRPEEDCCSQPFGRRAGQRVGFGRFCCWYLSRVQGSEGFRAFWI